MECQVVALSWPPPSAAAVNLISATLGGSLSQRKRHSVVRPTPNPLAISAIEWPACSYMTRATAAFSGSGGAVGHERPRFPAPATRAAAALDRRDGPVHNRSSGPAARRIGGSRGGVQNRAFEYVAGCAVIPVGFLAGSDGKPNAVLVLDA